MILTKPFKAVAGKVAANMQGVTPKAAVKAVAGAVASRVRNETMPGRVAKKMQSKIGPEGVVGMKNMATQTKTMKGMLKKGDMKGAVGYMRSQSAKVRAK